MQGAAIDLDGLYCEPCGLFLDCEHAALDAAAMAALRASLCADGYCIVRSSSCDDSFHRACLAMQSFFRLPAEEKERAVSLDKARRGYSPLGSENFASLTGHKKENDTVEKFRIGPLLDGSPEQEAAGEYYTCKEGRVHFFPNVWPAVDGFREAVSAYYRRMEFLAHRILRLLEVLFQLPRSSLCETLRRHTSILGANAYLPLPTRHAPSQLVERVAEHVDVSLFTIVAEQNFAIRGDPVERGNGLELQMFSHQAASWRSIHLARNEFLVNIGECLQYWSGHRLTPARHRVVEFSESQPCERYSLAFFCSPAYSTLLRWPRTAAEAPTDAVHAQPEDDYSTWRKKKIKKTLQCIKLAAAR